MGKIVFLLVLAMVSAEGFAQANEPERGLTIDFSAGVVSNSCNHDGTSHSYGVGTSLNPRVGYRINPRVEVGAMVSLSILQPGHIYSVGVWGEYNFLRFGRHFSLFGDFQALKAFNRSSMFEKNIAEVGFVPGIAYNIPGTAVDVKLRYLFIGYYNIDKFYKEESKGMIGSHACVIDASLSRLQIGVSITFGK